MTKQKLLAILGYLNIGLAVAHNAGVSVGHFGSTDFLTLADEVNSLLLNSIAPPTPAVAATPIPAGTVYPAQSTPAATN